MFVFELKMGAGMLGWSEQARGARKKGVKSGQKVTEIYTFCKEMNKNCNKMT